MNNNRENYAMFIVCNIFTHTHTNTTTITTGNNKKHCGNTMTIFCYFFSIIIYEHPVYIESAEGKKKKWLASNAHHFGIILHLNYTYGEYIYTLHKLQLNEHLL